MLGREGSIHEMICASRLCPQEAAEHQQFYSCQKLDHDCQAQILNAAGNVMM